MWHLGARVPPPILIRPVREGSPQEGRGRKELGLLSPELEVKGKKTA